MPIDPSHEACRIYSYWSAGVRDVAETPTTLRQYLVVPLHDCPEPGYNLFAIHVLVGEDTMNGHMTVVPGALAEGWARIDKKLDALNTRLAKRVSVLGTAA